MRREALIAAVFGAVFCFACWAVALYQLAKTPQARAAGEGASRIPAADPFDAYLRADLPVADGFDFPVGDREGEGTYVDPATGKRHTGWRVDTAFGQRFRLGLHPGEDWNGRGGADTDRGQPVHCLAAGRVIVADDFGQPWGRVVMVEHLFYENHHKKRIRSVYAHLASMEVEPGQDLSRRQVIGSIGQDPKGLYRAHLHLELRWDLGLPPTYWPSSHDRDRDWLDEHYAPPSAFIRSHRRLFVPQAERTLVLVHRASASLRLVQAGKRVAQVPVGFGQREGRKRRRGDLRTPLGQYRVVHRHRGEFSGRFGAYYGGHWIKINYPNPADAAWGLTRGLITRAQAAAIGRAFDRRAATPGKTRLGGGIGFHGWIDDWDLDGDRLLSWGCVVMRNADIRRLYDRIPIGAAVVLF